MEPVQPKALGQPVRNATYMAEHDFMEDHDDAGGGTSPAAWVGCVLCLPLAFVASFFTVNEREHAVLLSCGKYDRIVKEPGCHWANCCGRDLRKISVAQTTIQLQPCKMVDHTGTPLIVSAIVTYYIANARRAALNISSAPHFIRDQAESVLKQVVSRYPYETTDGTPCLKNEPQAVGRELVELLQHKSDVAGTKIISFDLNELTYAPEIASGMLRRQQANALIQARKTIVEGATQISAETLTALEKMQVTMSPAEKARLVTNLLTVICSEHDANPVVSL